MPGPLRVSSPGAGVRGGYWETGGVPEDGVSDLSLEK